MKRLLAGTLLVFSVGCHERTVPMPMNEVVATVDAGGVEVPDAGADDAGLQFIEGTNFHSASTASTDATLFAGVAFDSVGMVAVGTAGRDAVAVRVLFDGGVDWSFATAGAFFFDGAAGLDDDARAVAIAPNGRIAIVGATAANGREEFLVLQLLSDGARDPSFGVAGQVSLELGAPGQASDVAVQPDGKLVVVGNVRGPTERAIVLRLLTDGRLDVGFGLNGSVRLNGVLGDSRANAVAVLPDGHIVVSGVAAFDRGAFPSQPTVVRLSASGALDSSFGTNGVVELGEPTPLSTSGELAVREDGSLVVLLPGKVFALTAAGALDRAWGGDGVVLLDESLDARAVGFAPSGRVLLAGGVFTAPNQLEVATARLTARGALDVTFGVGGVRRAGHRGVLSGLSARADGRAAAVGAVHLGSFTTGFVVRFLN